MTLSMVVEIFEKSFTPHPEVGNFSQCPTAEPYVTITSGGVKIEGDPVPCLSTSPYKAISLYEEALKDYSRGKKGTLYWRRRPTLEYKEIDNALYFFVYSRLVVSDQPQVRPAKLPPA